MLILASAMCAIVNADTLPWALVRVSVANIRENQGHASEMGSQVIMGTPLKILSGDGQWYHVETPEGYQGYVIENSLQLLSEEDMQRWREADRVVVTSPDQTYIYATDASLLNMSERERRLHRISDVMNGSLLEVVSYEDDGIINVAVPDGRVGKMLTSDVAKFGEWKMNEVDVDSVLDFARVLMGTPYLWGGTSTKSMDCSGLTKIAFLSQGIILPRNASQQAKTGMQIPLSDRRKFKKGDLLFFGNSATGRINHVGMYLGNDRFIHCSGRVKINSLDPQDSDYTPVDLLAVRRLDTATLRSLSIRQHPWF